MRKIALASIPALLLLTAIPNQLNAASMAGAKCTKAGSTKTASNIKYTCVKQGSKLVWNKGVAVKPAVKPTPTPVETPKPASTPSPTPTATVAAFVPPKAPTSFDDLVENYKGISYAAWSKSKAKIASSKATANNLVMHIGPKSVIPNPNPQIAYDLIAKLYDGFKTPPRTDILAFGWADRDWAELQMKTIMPSSTWQWIKYTACATQDTCWGGGAFRDANSNFLLVITTEVKDANHTSGTLEAHEYTHIIQQSQMKGEQPWPPSNDWPPTWIIEGHAEFSQNVAVFTDSFDAYLKNRRDVSQNLFRDPKYDSAFFEKYFVVNPPSSWYDQYDRWNQYEAGGMLVEILTALKGPDSVMEMWRQMGLGLNFRDAFKKVYEYDFDRALPIMAKAIALEVGKS